MSHQKPNTKSWQVPNYSTEEFFKKKTKYALIIPVFNEGKRIQKELQKLKLYSKQIDIIIADGGSTDNSTNQKLLKSLHVRTLLINTEQNKGGQGTQLRMALSYALNQGYEGVITIDGNNKDDVSKIPLFIKALDEGFDYVQASRFIKGGKYKNTPPDRIFFNRYIISPILSLAAGKWFTDIPNNFRAYSKKYLLHPKLNPFRNIFVRYELIFYLSTKANRLGLKSKEIPTTRIYPKGEVPTKITGWKKVTDFLEIIKIALGFYNPS